MVLDEVPPDWNDEATDDNLDTDGDESSVEFAPTVPPPDDDFDEFDEDDFDDDFDDDFEFEPEYEAEIEREFGDLEEETEE
ncbi:MAG: hypothetical protein H5U08_04560, partial [Thermogutta sp.]|uniref:hypothetical protein n=1 Tax=Thermogutta sp. TaxID=1962930 RepID=UPI0019A4CFBB